jgi:hypothetical protein
MIFFIERVAFDEKKSIFIIFGPLRGPKMMKNHPEPKTWSPKK